MASPGLLACTASAALALATASQGETRAAVRPLAQCPIESHDLLLSLTESFEAADARAPPPARAGGVDRRGFVGLSYNFR